MATILAIDPGPEVSGAVCYGTKRGAVVRAYPEIRNTHLLDVIGKNRGTYAYLAIEMIDNMGMAVGKSTFETVYWTGRFAQAFGADETTRVYRREVKLYLCGNMAAKDPNIRQAIIDLYPPEGGGSVPQIGIWKKQGPLYGVKKHAWAALGVAITAVAQQGDPRCGNSPR